MLEVLYSDNHLLAVNKPAGLLTQPSGTDKDSLETQAKAWIKLTSQKPGNVYLHAIHRLDAPVSGIVLFAKTSKALTRLQDQLRKQQFRKVYYASVSPCPQQPKASLVHWLVHRDHYAEIVAEAHPEGKRAELDYTVREVSGDIARLEIVLKTGRYHQIRAQLAAIGSPVVGDHRYGSKKHWGEGKIALHHGELEFTHPVTGEAIKLSCISDTVIKKPQTG